MNIKKLFLFYKISKYINFLLSFYENKDQVANKITQFSLIFILYRFAKKKPGIFNNF